MDIEAVSIRLHILVVGDGGGRVGRGYVVISCGGGSGIAAVLIVVAIVVGGGGGGGGRHLFPSDDDTYFGICGDDILVGDIDAD